MTTIIDRHNKMCNKVLSIKTDILRADKGQRAGGIRARKVLQGLVRDIKLLRKDIMTVRIMRKMEKDRKKAQEKNAQSTTTK